LLDLLFDRLLVAASEAASHVGGKRVREKRYISEHFLGTALIELISM
jgi:hypothetical protein